MDTTGIVNIRDQNNRSCGTGFFVTSEGHILTCRHVLIKTHYYKKYDMIQCRLCNPEYSFKAKWIDESENMDLAILQLEGYKGKYYPLTEDFQQHAECETFGFPNGEDIMFSARPVIETYTNLELHLSKANGITYGYSGAPLLNDYEMFMGIITGFPVTTEGRRLEEAYALSSREIFNAFPKYFDHLIGVEELYEKAMCLFRASQSEYDAESAISELLKLASAKFEKAALVSSYAFRFGEKVPMDLERSRNLLSLAIESREFDKTGKEWLEKGKSIWKDDKKSYEAISYLIAVAEYLQFPKEINAEACCWAAKIFLHKKSDVYSKERAAKYFYKAMILENDNGKFGYALCLYEGSGVEMNKKMAVQYMEELASVQYKKACDWLKWRKA